jgi:hypothetical protein
VDILLKVSLVHGYVANIHLWYALETWGQDVL